MCSNERGVRSWDRPPSRPFVALRKGCEEKANATDRGSQERTRVGFAPIIGGTLGRSLTRCLTLAPGRLGASYINMHKNKNRVFERSGGFFPRAEADGSKIETPATPEHARGTAIGEISSVGFFGVMIVLFWFFLRYLD